MIWQVWECEKADVQSSWERGVQRCDWGSLQDQVRKPVFNFTFVTSIKTLRNEILTRQECKVETIEQCAPVPEEQCSPVSFLFSLTFVLCSLFLFFFHFFHYSHLSIGVSRWQQGNARPIWASAARRSARRSRTRSAASRPRSSKCRRSRSNWSVFSCLCSPAHVFFRWANAKMCPKLNANCATSWSQCLKTPQNAGIQSYPILKITTFLWTFSHNQNSIISINLYEQQKGEYDVSGMTLKKSVKSLMLKSPTLSAKR